MIVIIAYLLYGIYEADFWLRQEGDFFQTLGLPHDADDKRIKSRFRRLYVSQPWAANTPCSTDAHTSFYRAAVYHPDKLATDDPAALASAEMTFHALKTAQDTLSDPVKRFAYERFGKASLTWQHCVTIRDYLSRGLQQIQAPMYVGTGAFLIILSFTSYLSAGRFWRYAFFLALMVLEAHTVTRPYHTPILAKALNPALEKLARHPPLLPFQLLTLARKVIFTLFMAFSQLSGLFPTKTEMIQHTVTPSPHEMQQLMRLEQAAKGSDAEATRLLGLDMSPFVGDEVGTKELRGRVRDWLVNNAIRADPEVRDAMGRALKRRRVGAPAGARN